VSAKTNNNNQSAFPSPSLRVFSLPRLDSSSQCQVELTHSERDLLSLKGFVESCLGFLKLDDVLPGFLLGGSKLFLTKLGGGGEGRQFRRLLRAGEDG